MTDPIGKLTYVLAYDIETYAASAAAGAVGVGGHRQGRRDPEPGKSQQFR